MKTSKLEATVGLARALAHPARVRTLAMLHTGELCVCQITEVLQLAASTVSAHLRELKLAGLVRERKEGRWVYVGLSKQPETARWIELALEALHGEPQLEADGRLVAELRRLPLEDLCRLGYEAAKANSRSSSAAVAHRRRT